MKPSPRVLQSLGTSHPARTVEGQPLKAGGDRVLPLEPLQASEWPGMTVQVTLLDAVEALNAGSEADALAALRPGVDGVIFDWRGARATLLPQVWAQCRTPAQFMTALKPKARLPADFWAHDVRLWRYGVRIFDDKARQAQTSEATG